METEISTSTVEGFYGRFSEYIHVPACGGEVDVAVGFGNGVDKLYDGM